MTTTPLQHTIMTYEESPAFESDNSLPANLNAKILYHLPSLSKAGQIQATCLFLHENKEYRGIVFSQDNESWLKDVLPGAIVKVTDVSPCGYAKYAGQYMGTAYAVEDNKYAVPIQNSNEKYTAYLARLLRCAADTIERVTTETLETNPIEEIVAKTKTPVKLKYKRSDEWEVIIKKIVMESDNLRTKPFSGISLNAYIDACYTDWEEGDSEKFTHTLRWKKMVAIALANLLQDNFVEKVPGTKKHYRVTQEALDSYF